MQDQCDDGGTYAIEDGGYRLQVAEIDIENAQCGDDDKVRKDESPATRPGSPKPATEIGNVDANLDRERSWKRLANRDRLTHLLLGEPFPVIDMSRPARCDLSNFVLAVGSPQNRLPDAGR